MTLKQLFRLKVTICLPLYTVIPYLYFLFNTYFVRDWYINYFMEVFLKSIGNLKLLFIVPDLLILFFIVAFNCTAILIPTCICEWLDSAYTNKSEVILNNSPVRKSYKNSKKYSKNTYAFSEKDLELVDDGHILDPY